MRMKRWIAVRCGAALLTFTVAWPAWPGPLATRESTPNAIAGARSVDSPGQIGSTAAISVDVQYVDCLASAGDEAASATVSRSSATGITVNAVAAGDGTADPVTSATSSGFGGTALNLSPGTYWLFVPLISDAATDSATYNVTTMPDGTPVLAWVEVEITPASNAIRDSVTLSIELADCGPSGAPAPDA
jgi:hypothetical protein